MLLILTYVIVIGKYIDKIANTIDKSFLFLYICILNLYTMKTFLLGGVFFWLFWPFFVHSQCGPTDHGGADWIISASTTIGGTHTNVGKFQIEIGVTVTVDSACRYLEVQADTIVVYGTINADGKGDVGGAGGAGGTYANGSGVPGHAGQAGLAGYGSGGGLAGAVAGDGGYITQICGGFLCSGNRDGMNGGGGGAGGGSGGSYAGLGGAGGYGAYGSGYTGAEGGDYGAGGARSNAYGTATGFDITWGSGGAGGGGGGGGWSSGTTGGKGGAGGGMVTLKAQYKMIVSGGISCNGTDGGVGGNGGGESDDNTLDCSTSGYNACGLCSESVFDAAGGAGGAGGGGSGGGILLESNGTLSVTGTLSVRGGAGGTAGTPNNLTGTCFDNARGGAGGGGGRVKILKNPCVTVLMNPVVNTSGGIGGNGVVVGNNGDSGSYRNNLTAQTYVGLDGGLIGSVDSIFCDYGDVPLIGSTVAASGGILGNYSYQWQYSTTDSVSGYVNLPGQISVTCDPGLISTTTWYRRKVTSGNCTEYSNFAKALVIDCSSINESNQLDFNIFPVPSDGRFKIEMPLPIPAGSSVEIYNQLGEKISLIQIKESVSELAVNLKVKPGMYFVLVRTTDQQGLRKITIE